MSDDTTRKQTRLTQEYDAYLHAPKSSVRVTQTTAPADPYAVTTHVTVELPDDGEKVVTEEVAKTLLAQCRAFTSEVWPDLSLRALYQTAVLRSEAGLHVEEGEMQTVETQPALEALPTVLDLEGKDLDSSFLGTLPGASFILPEPNSSQSLRDLLGEPIPDLSFLLSAAVCR